MPDLIDTPAAAHSARNSPPRNLVSVELASIEYSLKNPRSTPGRANIEALADSIRMEGLLQPVTLRLVGDSTFPFYEIVAGERRVRACKLLELTHIEAIVITTDDTDLTWKALAENMQREDLNPVDIAHTLKKLMDADPALTQAAVGVRLGQSQAWVAKKLRLLFLPGHAFRALWMGTLSEAHATALCALSEHVPVVEALYNRIVVEGLNSKQTEEAVREAKAEIERKAKEAEGQDALPLMIGDEVADPAGSSTLDDIDDTEEAGAPAQDVIAVPATAPVPTLAEVEVDGDDPAEAETDDEVVLPVDQELLDAIRAEDAPEAAEVVDAPIAAPSNGNHPLPSPSIIPGPKNVTPGAPVAVAPAPVTVAPPVAIRPDTEGRIIQARGLLPIDDDFLFDSFLSLDEALAELRVYRLTDTSKNLVKALTDEFQARVPAADPMPPSQMLEMFLSAYADTRGIDIATIKELPL